jgi:hypothetical protein
MSPFIPRLSANSTCSSSDTILQSQAGSDDPRPPKPAPDDVSPDSRSHYRDRKPAYHDSRRSEVRSDRPSASWNNPRSYSDRHRRSTPDRPGAPRRANTALRMIVSKRLNASSSACNLSLLNSPTTVASHHHRAPLPTWLPPMVYRTTSTLKLPSPVTCYYAPMTMTTSRPTLLSACAGSYRDPSRVIGGDILRQDSRSKTLIGLRRGVATSSGLIPRRCVILTKSLRLDPGLCLRPGV